MTTSRKFYLAVLIVAVVALIWDKASNNAVTQPGSSFAGEMPVSNHLERFNSARRTVIPHRSFSPSSINQAEQLTADNIKTQSHPQPISDERILERDLFVATESFQQGLLGKASKKMRAYLKICSQF